MKHRHFIILFIIIVFSYFLLYAFAGYNDADDGYVLALSWRVFNGEVPYRDFISIRPPLSPVFHSLPLHFIPANYQILFERFLFYVLVALSSLFGALTLNTVFRFKDYQIDPYLLAAAGFVFSVHNFPPMPWYTVDGIFFASLGIFILARYSGYYAIFSGILFLFLSALCKQPFYLMPFVGIGFVTIVHKDWRRSAAAVLSLLLFAGIFVFIFYRLGALKSFITLTTGSTKLSDLIAAGMLGYLRVYSLYIIVPFAFWVIARRLSAIPRFSRITELVPYVFISFPLLYPLAQFSYAILYKGVPYDPVFSYSFEDNIAVFLFIACVFLFILNFRMEKNWLSFGFLALLSWCSGISWGAQTPVLFSVPLLFGFFMIAFQYFNIKNVSRLAAFTLMTGIFTYYVAYQKPVCNPLRKDLNYELSGIFPKLKHLKVGADIYDKYNEFHSLVLKYGTNFKTLPGMPLANYLTDTKSPLAIDWVANAEIGNGTKKLINTLSEKNVTVFMERKPPLISVDSTQNKFNSSVSYFIKTNWIRIDSTRYFYVYKNKL